MRTMRAGYINDIYDFDNKFFNISAKETLTCDPQQRLMSELVYHHLQDAKIDINGTKTGVFQCFVIQNIFQSTNTRSYFFKSIFYNRRLAYIMF